jgi:hypothetical protein
MSAQTEDPSPAPAPSVRPPPGIISEPHSPVHLRPGYSVPLPESVPRTTVWPPFAALSVMLVGWGIIMSLAIFLIGAALLATSIVGWIGEIRHERSEA